MIIILSTDRTERTTEEVIDWLYFYEASYKRINGELIHGDIEYAITLTNSNQKKKGLFSLQVDDISIIWLRKWNSSEKFNFTNKLRLAKTAIELNKYLDTELLKISNIFFDCFKDKKWIDHPKNVKISKLEVLKVAKEIGLQIPATLITNSKREVADFLGRHKRIITKSVGDSGSFSVGDDIYALYTKEVTSQELVNVREMFFPSLFQQLLEKKYELRIFYLNGKCFSMAIFSQTNIKTEIDFREYDTVKPNRTVPFNIPLIISDKINRLMNALNLITGSIDMIVTLNNDYFFLEVNPVGQFGMVSKPCNYHLEKQMAEYLISIENENIYPTS